MGSPNETAAFRHYFHYYRFVREGARLTRPELTELTEQCDQEGKECQHRFVCPPKFKFKQPDGNCEKYQFDKEFHSGWT